MFGNELLSFYLILITISFIIGISLSWIIGLDITEIQYKNELSFIFLSPLLISFYTFSSNILILLLFITGFTLLINNKNNLILTAHWIMILWITYLIEYSDNNLITLLLILLCLDMCSVLQVALLPINIPSNGPWYYLLYQSFITISIWWLISNDNLDIVYILYYWKLGAGVGGYYLPSFYLTLSSNNIYSLLYVGCSTILLMYNGVKLFINMNISSNNFLIIFSIFILFLILYQWTVLGNWFISHWLYSLAASTCITCTVILILISSIIYLNVSSVFILSWIGAFLVTTQLVWCCLILNISFSNT